MRSSTPLIWYVHPYAGGPGIGRHNRPFLLSQNWARNDVRSIIISAANHHLLDQPQPEGRRNVSGVDYHFLRTAPYETNGLSRLRNMFGFSATLWRNGRSLAQLYGKPDLVIASSPHPYAFLAAERLARTFRSRLAFEVRDLWPLSLVELAGVSAEHPLVRATAWLEQRAYRKADAVVSLLPETRNYMTSRGLRPEKWHYIPNGIDVEGSADLKESPPLLRARQLHTEGHCVVLYAGAIGRPNNIDKLIEAAAIVRDSGRNSIRVMIVGRGESEHLIREKIAGLGLQSIIDLFPQIDKASVLSLMHEVDIGFVSLLPSPLFRFGVSPNKIFDYMSVGLPIVSAIEAGNDLVAEAQCGLSVAPGNAEAIADAIIQLAEASPERRATLGRNGLLATRGKYNYETLAKRYLELLPST